MTNELPTTEGVALVAGDILKTDVLGRLTISPAHREAILDAFEASSMSGQAFALQHGIKIQTFANWMQKRRRARGDYKNEAICRKLRMRKDPPSNSPRPKKSPSLLPSMNPSMNLIEVDLKKETPSASEQPLEVVLPSGTIVRVSHESQLTLLQTLIQKLTC